MGAGSPSPELGGGSRAFSKRAVGIWGGPPTSGNSTPLRENIPESPCQDEFSNLSLLPSETTTTTSTLQSPARRTRAGTVPSRFPPVGTLGGVNLSSSLMPKTSRPTPSTSPFRPPHISGFESGGETSTPGGTSDPGISRFRSGSMPMKDSNPFGPSVFSSNWAAGRDRATTLSSIRSSEGPTSPTQSSFSKDGLADADLKTMVYLGLAETPQQSRATLARPMEYYQEPQQQQQSSQLPPLFNYNDVLRRSSNRFRSYSVNAKEKYAEDDASGYDGQYSSLPSGTLTPAAAAAAAQLAQTRADIYSHNLAVQAFTSQASASRPRAQTASALEAPSQRSSSIRNYLATPSRLDSGLTAAELRISENGEYDDISDNLRMMQLGMGGLRPGQEPADENNLEGPTRALWIGSIPVSTTVSSLEAIFCPYGKIESARVLTHKNCGFVNYEHVESAIQAKSLLNAKEIFPGAGPVRIGYAKVPTSGAGTPGHNGVQPSPTPDLAANGSGLGADGVNGVEQSESEVPHLPQLHELQPEMEQMVLEFGASDQDRQNISASIQRAVAFQNFIDEIPPIPEPSQTRMHDAPRLRDIRKRIDSGSYSTAEIEDIAINMLPEIAELSPDYLGNTVVQKLFECCSDTVKERMLAEIAPHLAEIGVHKNGTWAAQKIIEVAKTTDQKRMIVESIRPYAVPLFLDQYGNYVLQGCLRFGPPFNDFLFESMLSRMWEIAQGRFGARATRACLESHHTTKDQQRMLAAAIVLHSVQLASNANGALLLTWFLDTCNFPRRRTVLAPRLVPHLVSLCTHKVAYLTVLKVINQRNEPEAREIILKALFFTPGDEVLEKILSDQNSGATLIFKVLTTPFFDNPMRAEVVKTVAKVLTKLKVPPSQGYKRLMDEVGLSSRSSSSRDGQQHVKDHSSTPPTSSHNDRHAHRPTSRHGSGNGYPMHHQQERQYSGQYMPNLQHQPYDAPPMARSLSSDHGLSPYDLYGLSGVNGVNGLGNLPALSNPGFAQDPIVGIGPLQYQALLAAQSRNLAAANAFYQPLPSNGFNGYATQAPAPDPFRALQQPSPLPGHAQLSGSPMMQQPNFATPPQYSPVVPNAQMYSYQPQYYQQPQPGPMPGQAGRRGRGRPYSSYSDFPPDTQQQPPR